MMLGGLFFLVALFYASVGFGGGSSYLALLALWNAPYVVIPAIALTCNIIVVSGNSFHYIRSNCLNWRLLLPLTLASVPFAYIGGRIEIGKEWFLFLLFITLLAAGIRLMLNYRLYEDRQVAYRAIPIWQGGTLGALIGLLSGIVGIGGGIFLAPILYNLRAGSTRQIAAAASFFILVNSVAGLAGQLQKNGVAEAAFDYWYLPLLAFIGGQCGSLLTLKWVPPRMIALLTALLVLVVAARLGFMLATS